MFVTCDTSHSLMCPYSISAFFLFLLLHQSWAAWWMSELLRFRNWESRSFAPSKNPRDNCATFQSSHLSAFRNETT